MENEVKAILSDAQALVSDQCSQLVLSISERDYVGDERKTAMTPNIAAIAMFAMSSSMC